MFAYGFRDGKLPVRLRFRLSLGLVSLTMDDVEDIHALRVDPQVRRDLFEGQIIPPHPQSMRVLSKLGMSLRERRLWHSLDTVYYEINAQDFAD